jgi:hypothetical protein
VGRGVAGGLRGLLGGSKWEGVAMFGNWFLELAGSSLDGVGISNDCLWVMECVWMR